MSYFMLPNDDLVGLDMSAGTNFTLTLPPANEAGRTVIVKIEKYSSAPVPLLTIQPFGGDSLEGGPQNVLGSTGASRTLYSDGLGKWYTY